MLRVQGFMFDSLMIIYFIICCHILYFIIMVYTAWKGLTPQYLVYCTAGGSLLIMLCVQGLMGCQAPSPLFWVIKGNIDNIVLQCLEQKRMAIGLV